MKKSIVALVLALLMVVGLVPSVSATEMHHSIIIAPQYEEVGPFAEGYAAVKLNGKWGYINEAGEMVVDPKYDWAGCVSEGVAVTLVLGDCEDGFGEITQGYYAHLIDMNGMDKPLYWRDGYYYEDDYEYKDGVYFTFPLIIGEFFDEFFWWYPNCEASNFFANTSIWCCNDGIVNVGGIPFTTDGEKVNVQNKDDYYMKYCDFNQTSPCVDGVIPMQVTEEATPMCDAMQIDSDGNVLFYSSDYCQITAPWEDLQMACKRIVIESDDMWVEEEYLWGLMDAEYNWISEPQYTDFMYTYDGALFHDGLMPVQFKTGKWGAINTSGELVIDAQYDAMSCFSNGFSRVMQEGKHFFIDTAGTPYTILSPDGSTATVALSSKVSSDGLAAVYDSISRKAYYINLLSARDGVIPAVTGSDCLDLESYISDFDEDGIPLSIAIPSKRIPIKEGDLWGFAEWSFPSPSNPYTDVPAGSFCYDPVLWAVEQGITSGTSATTFSPGDACMRAYVVTFLWRAAGCPEPKSSANPFVDVAPGSFYEKPVLWAVENNITNGADATHFNPAGVCNRAQIVTFLYRAFGSPAVDTNDLPFSDVPAGSWCAAPVAWAVKNDITNGLSATSFGPETSCNRAQVVTFLYRAYN